MNESIRSYDDFRNPKGKGQELELLFELARAGETQSICELVSEHPGILGLRDSRGYSVFMIATYNGQLDLAKELLRLGANPDEADNGGNSALMGAAFKGNLEMAKLLIDNGANPKLKNGSGQDALQFAEMFGRAKVAAHLSGRSLSSRLDMTKSLQSWFRFFVQNTMKLVASR